MKVNTIYLTLSPDKTAIKIPFPPSIFAYVLFDSETAVVEGLLSHSRTAAKLAVVSYGSVLGHPFFPNWFVKNGPEPAHWTIKLSFFLPPRSGKSRDSGDLPLPNPSGETWLTQAHHKKEVGCPSAHVVSLISGAILKCPPILLSVQKAATEWTSGVEKYPEKLCRLLFYLWVFPSLGITENHAQKQLPVSNMILRIMFLWSTYPCI